MDRHFTVTTYVIENQSVLLIFHPKFNKWLPPGGHLEANETPPEGAKREVFEETGLDIAFIEQENLQIDAWNASSFARPYLCLLEHIPAHNASPAHQHMDLIYLARPAGGVLHANLIDQNLLRWFTLAEVDQLKKDEDIFGETQATIRHILSSHA